MTTMIERVARAIATALADLSESADGDWDAATDVEGAAAKAIARAAIGAMREPGEQGYEYGQAPQ